KLALARQLGATDTINAADADAVAQARDATSGGADYAFEMAGSVKAMALAYRVTRRGGTTVSAGLSHPDRTFDLPHVSLVAEERTVKGSYVGSCVPLRDVPRYIALYQQGRLPVDRLTGDRIGFDQLNAAFDRLAEGHVVRQILVPA
ncbi:MAG: zinc-binding dehydrogenase, partial [Pseudomonadota bacterium]